MIERITSPEFWSDPWVWLASGLISYALCGLVIVARVIHRVGKDGDFFYGEDRAAACLAAFAICACLFVFWPITLMFPIKAADDDTF